MESSCENGQWLRSSSVPYSNESSNNIPKQKWFCVPMNYLLTLENIKPAVCNFTISAPKDLNGNNKPPSAGILQHETCYAKPPQQYHHPLRIWSSTPSIPELIKKKNGLVRAPSAKIQARPFSATDLKRTETETSNLAVTAQGSRCNLLKRPKNRVPSCSHTQQRSRETQTESGSHSAQNTFRNIIQQIIQKRKGNENTKSNAIECSVAETGLMEEIQAKKCFSEFPMLGPSDELQVLPCSVTSSVVTTETLHFYLPKQQAEEEEEEDDDKMIKPRSELLTRDITTKISADIKDKGKELKDNDATELSKREKQPSGRKNRVWDYPRPPNVPSTGRPTSSHLVTKRKQLATKSNLPAATVNVHYGKQDKDDDDDDDDDDIFTRPEQYRDKEMTLKEGINNPQHTYTTLKDLVEPPDRNMVQQTKNKRHVPYTNYYESALQFSGEVKDIKVKTIKTFQFSLNGLKETKVISVIQSSALHRHTPRLQLTVSARSRTSTLPFHPRNNTCEKFF
nr:PREDICTED: uncharacterized protein LOC102348958 [Latimeria chalumnae]|eukprot:XP_005987422.1 PREDICTED: uncharacterized protein LOC102348958 [Latimeria chalumnae]